MNKRIKGTIMIDAAIGIPILLFVIFIWVDLCFLFFAISSTEHAFAQAVFQAKKVDIDSDPAISDFSQIIHSKLGEYGGALSGDSTDQSSIEVTVSYFADFPSLLQCVDAYEAQNCPSASTNSNNGAIAIYSLRYTHTPLIFSGIPSISISREITAVQEYERCKLDTSGSGCV